jgi:hypothetical protein
MTHAHALTHSRDCTHALLTFILHRVYFPALDYSATHTLRLVHALSIHCPQDKVAIKANVVAETGMQADIVRLKNENTQLTVKTVLLKQQLEDAVARIGVLEIEAKRVVALESQVDLLEKQSRVDGQALKVSEVLLNNALAEQEHMQAELQALRAQAAQAHPQNQIV